MSDSNVMKIAIDHQHLDRYTLGDKEVEKEILGLFSDQLPKNLQRLDQATTVKEFYEVAHTIKGSAKGVGAWNIAEMAELLETIDNLANSSCHQKIEELKKACDDVRNYIASLQ